ncbi:MAG: hypothetical protein ACOYZ6_19350 [Chloroflexota bacterium]
MNPDSDQELIDPQIALSVYDKVFSVRSGDEIVFTPQIPKVGILAAVYLTLKDEYVNAFIAAVKKVGENSFYLSLTERIASHYVPRKGYENEFREAIHARQQGSEYPFAEKVTPIINDWFFPLEAASSLTLHGSQDKPYQNIDNAIYSVNGNWGLWFSNDGFAIIGGSEEFVTTFYGVINKTIEEMAVRFIKAIQNKQTAFQYLRSLFGVDEAERYIKIFHESI